jgi:hypothetical protein
VIEKTGDSILGFVSWNGATDIEAYNVYIVETGTTPRLYGKATVFGFETGFDLGAKFNETNCIMAAAVRDGLEVRQSNVGCLQGRTFVSTFTDANGDASGDSVVEETLMQKILGVWYP